MMPAQPTATLPRDEPFQASGIDAKTVVVSQESAPIGPAGDPGFHLFTVSLRVADPKEGQWAKQTAVPCTFKAPTGWQWVDWANHYWYNDNTYTVNGLVVVSPPPTINGDTLTFSMDMSLNTTPTDSDRLCFTLLIQPKSTASGTQKDGLATIGVKGENLLPVTCPLWAIVPS
ncbi:hypothetical protein ACFRAR_19920 [Kitasatospora sp. NPDC056651]|uniref:hypothetical protein n=1 Tax=Kitasatospora sp. NPDC056651 TaxID=3345892 RepID=UPI00369D87BB